MATFLTLGMGSAGDHPHVHCICKQEQNKELTTYYEMDEDQKEKQIDLMWPAL